MQEEKKGKRFKMSIRISEEQRENVIKAIKQSESDVLTINDYFVKLMTKDFEEKGII